MVSYNFSDFQSSTCQPTKQMKKVKYRLRKDRKGTIEYIIIKEVIQSIHREKKTVNNKNNKNNDTTRKEQQSKQPNFKRARKRA